MLFLIIVGFSHNSQKKYDPNLKLKMFQFFDNIIKALQWISDFHYNSQKVKAIRRQQKHFFPDPIYYWLSVSERLLFNAKWTYFQLYHGENKLHLMMLMMSALC
jgi:hypothetical protein